VSVIDNSGIEREAFFWHLLNLIDQVLTAYKYYMLCSADAYLHIQAQLVFKIAL